MDFGLGKKGGSEKKGRGALIVADAGQSMNPRTRTGTRLARLQCYGMDPSADWRTSQPRVHQPPTTTGTHLDIAWRAWQSLKQPDPLCPAPCYVARCFMVPLGDPREVARWRRRGQAGCKVQVMRVTCACKRTFASRVGSALESRFRRNSSGSLISGYWGLTSNRWQWMDACAAGAGCC